MNTKRSSNNTNETFTVRELFRMGYFNATPRVANTTSSGRGSLQPERFSNQHFIKGSGCCSRKGMDPTVIIEDGDD